MTLPYKNLEKIEALAQDVKNLYKTMLSQDIIDLYNLDSYDLETCRVMIDKMSCIINEANWCQHQSKDFVRMQTNKVFGNTTEETV